MALARALAPAPEVVLLDEPFAALDAALRAEIREDVRVVLHATGATGVLVTHDQEEALSIADEVAVMRRGQVVQLAPPVELYSVPVDLEVARFVGEGVEFVTEARDGVAVTPLGALPVDGAGSGRGVVLVRPEQLVLGGEGAPGRVCAVVFYGHDAVVQVELEGGQQVSVRTAGARRGARGGRRPAGGTWHGSLLPVRLSGDRWRDRLLPWRHVVLRGRRAEQGADPPSARVEVDQDGLGQQRQRHGQQERRAARSSRSRSPSTGRSRWSPG